MAAKQFEKPFPIQKRHYFIRAFIPKAGSAIRIDMVNHKVYVTLGKRIKGRAFGDKHAEELMVPLTGPFLPGEEGAQ